MERDRRRRISVAYVCFFLYFACLKFGIFFRIAETNLVISLLLVSAHTMYMYTHKYENYFMSCPPERSPDIKKLINKSKLQTLLSQIFDSCSISIRRTLLSMLVNFQAFKEVRKWIWLSSFQSWKLVCIHSTRRCTKHNKWNILYSSWVLAYAGDLRWCLFSQSSFAGRRWSQFWWKGTPSHLED